MNFHQSELTRVPSVELPVALLPRRNIVWLASYPKSGNTWVRVFLHNLMRELLGETQGAADINDLGRFTIWEHSLPHFHRVLGKSPHAATIAELAAARPKVQRMISSELPANAIAKTHLCFGRDHGHPTVDLEVTRKIIYVVRDPRDVAVSYSHHCNKNIATIVNDMATPNFIVSRTNNHVCETIGSWSQHVTSWLSVTERPLHLMRYEDMLENPAAAFSKLAAFLELTPSQDQLDSAVRKSRFSELSKQEKERGFRERPANMASFFRKGAAGQWKQRLTSLQAANIARSHSEAMMRIGYLRAHALVAPGHTIEGISD